MINCKVTVPYPQYSYKANVPAATGLAFSVNPEYAVAEGINASLKNIFKELENDIEVPWDINPSPDLTRWAKQGVFLLNTTLTVREGQPNSHKDIGWRRFTRATIKAISEQDRSIAYIGWGNYAQKVLDEYINIIRDARIYAPHPSPLSAHRGFFGSMPFSKTNAFLKETNQQPIKW